MKVIKRFKRSKASEKEGIRNEMWMLGKCAEAAFEDP